MKRKLVFATNNAHKLEEVAAILGNQIELLSLNPLLSTKTIIWIALPMTPDWKWKH